MPDYSEAKIYKIVDNTNDNIYIGSTCQKLSQRLSEHVRHFKQYKEGKKVGYVTSYKIIENEDYDIILIEKYNCKDKEELHKRERFYIEKFECVNKNIPGRTRKESCKEYREANKELIKEKASKLINCICGSEIQIHEKSRHSKTKKHINFINNQTN